MDESVEQNNLGAGIVNANLSNLLLEGIDETRVENQSKLTQECLGASSIHKNEESYEGYRSQSQQISIQKLILMSSSTYSMRYVDENMLSEDYGYRGEITGSHPSMVSNDSQSSSLMNHLASL